MSEKIEPALTSDEWAALERDRQRYASKSRELAAESVLKDHVMDREGYWNMSSDPAKTIALANDALPDSDPRKLRAIRGQLG